MSNLNKNQFSRFLQQFKLITKTIINNTQIHLICYNLKINAKFILVEFFFTMRYNLLQSLLFMIFFIYLLRERSLLN